MSQSVKVKVRPGRAIRIPEICVHCSQPAGERMNITMRRGRITRLIDVPVCDDCSRELHLMSAEEERLQRFGWITAGVTGIALLVAGVFLLPGVLPIWLRFFVSLVLAALIAAGVWSIFKRKSLDAARPKKKAILNSARMVEFSWRATTFQFENDEFAEWFIELNEANLMET